MKPLMIIPQKKEIQKHQRVLGGFLPQLLSVLLVCSLVFPPSYSKAEDTETSGQLLSNQGFESNKNTTNPTNWTVKGTGQYVCDTCGPVGGNALRTNQSGGSASQEVDLFGVMTQDEINNGFDLTYGADVYSHSSNASVPACSATEGDCKDSFSITLTINDTAGNELIKFENSYDDITWTGWDRNTFDAFTSTVPANEYTSAIATLELYGRDLGYTGGNNYYYGPRFDNTHLRATYTTQAALDVIAASTENALELVSQSIDAATEIATSETSTVEITINNPIANEVESFTIELPAMNTNVDSSMDMAPVEVASIEVPTFETPVDTGPMETTEVANIEVEMDNAAGDLQTATNTESGPSPDVEPEPQSEPTTETESREQTTEAGPSESSEGGGESEGTDTQSDGQSEETAEAESQDGNGDVRESPREQRSSEGNKSKPKSVKQAKKDAKQKVARKIVKSMGDKGRYDSTNQIRTLVVMGALGDSKSFFSVQRTIPDIPNFFQPTTVPDGTISDNNAAAYYMIGGSNAAHNALVNSQYEK